MGCGVSVAGAFFLQYQGWFNTLTGLLVMGLLIRAIGLLTLTGGFSAIS